jgi:hypothetical protein
LREALRVRRTMGRRRAETPVHSARG